MTNNPLTRMAWGQENDIKMDDGRWKRDEG